MGIYIDNAVIAEIEKTNILISSKISKNKKHDINNLIDEGEKERFLDFVLWAAWSKFYHFLTLDNYSFDKNTLFNQEYMSEQIRFSRKDYNDQKVVFLSNLLRVMYEYFFWTGKEIGHTFLDYDTLTELHNSFYEGDSIGLQFKWIRDNLSVSLVQWMLKSDDFIKAKSLVMDVDNEIRKLDDVVKEKATSFSSDVSNMYTNAQQTIKQDKETIVHMVDDIKTKVREINALDDKVSRLRTEYNFVGLSSGFNKIKEKKEEELRKVEVYYQNLFGCIFIAPVIVFILHFIKSDFYPTDYSALFLFFPLLTVELALIYFFRLSYLEAKSIRTQLVQIELRLSLCAFIEGYVDYRKKVEMKEPDLFKLFDSMIFSPIQVNENNIPSMFDGVEAIANLVDKVK
ncbi:hypothetical protein [Dickeya fangzhongdai]|uniref:Uncharacterized protein n=1 Tax=Dickeya fangzhongdai TaxID=1778540 RepID=A0A2K8QMX5_9GAMM|nr:hypothetical protein [Dickeya fangzhongdai]ATZ94405.1 hypothetical protein CVE23_10740 [Dickeya fangzhongdai]QOH47842.1 hypothetical protein DYD82_10790 [Dickeya fangzhongdai]QOH52147.1 hypothetical protein DYD83_10790 [Dickeya fangzhongdai]WOY00647.1 hypothetical protein OGM22_02080 [Dickeya fangzhongdai]WOY04203.1 hypothetical protein OGM21_20560 [Dickeya fangzhongdai]